AHEQQQRRQNPRPLRPLVPARLEGLVDAKFTQVVVHDRHYASRMVATMLFRDAAQAGRNPPSAPMNAANASPPAIASGPMRNLKATSLNVTKFPTPVVSPLIGIAISTPTSPPIRAR